jgi:hypothetical protein
MMSHNVGKIDRSIRIILGLIIVLLGFYFQSWWGLLGIIPISTAFISWCPVYSAFKITTCKQVLHNN